MSSNQDETYRIEAVRIHKVMIGQHYGPVSEYPPDGIPIELLNLPLKTYNWLKRAGIVYTIQLSSLSDEQLLVLPRSTQEYVADIHRELEQFRNNNH